MELKMDLCQKWMKYYLNPKDNKVTAISGHRDSHFIYIKNLEIDVKKHASSSLNLVFDFILNTSSANN